MSSVSPVRLGNVTDAYKTPGGDKVCRDPHSLFLPCSMTSLFEHNYDDKKGDSSGSLPQLEPVGARVGYERRTMYVFRRLLQSRLRSVPRRSVDLHLIPIVSLLYSFALIDRINLGAARTAGMGPALVSFLCFLSSLNPTIHYQHLEIGARFSIATVMYFIPYILL